MFPPSPLNLTEGRLSSCKHSLVNSLLQRGRRMAGTGDGGGIRHSSTGRLSGSMNQHQCHGVFSLWQSRTRYAKTSLAKQPEWLLTGLHTLFTHYYTLIYFQMLHSCCVSQTLKRLHFQTSGKTICLKFVIKLSITVQIVCRRRGADAQKRCPLELEIQTRATLTWFSL